MFKIRDGREYFYQWDINREVLVSDPTVNEVHFCNRTDDCSLVVEVKEVEIFADNKLAAVERYAEVPNILLQDTWKIKVYAYCGDKYTKVEETFTVKPRTKPSDYVYTETEVKTYSDLEKRLDEIEANGISQDSINSAVEKYLEENPIEIPETDLTGYATEDYVQQEIGKIDIPTVPTNVSAFTNDANYITESEVDNKLANLDIPEADVDLSNYYTKTEVDTKLEDIDVDMTVGISDDGAGNVTIQAVEGGSSDVDLSNYYTKDEVDNLIPEATDLSNYYTKSETETVVSDALSHIVIPTSLSQLNNDVGYLTEHQSLEGYASETYVNNMFNGANKAVAFDDYSKMISSLNSLGNTAYHVGQNVMIVTLEVPDLWVSEVCTDSLYYVYQSDAQVISELAQNGSIQVGYYKLSALETQKVEIGDYATVSNTENTSGFLDLSESDTATICSYRYTSAIARIDNLRTDSVTGMSVQFFTSGATSCEDTTAKWVGDDCTDGVFTPAVSTHYEVYSYYNSNLGKCVNMVMNLGAVS